MQSVLMYICVGLMLLFGVCAVMNDSILKSAIYLALASASLASLMFLLGATWSAVFELSVCSGLVTVIFISGISLSNEPHNEEERKAINKKRHRFLPALLIIVGAGIVAVVYTIGYTVPPTAAAGADFREILWNTRQADIWGQIAVVLCGGLAVSTLFKGVNR